MLKHVQNKEKLISIHRYSRRMSKNLWIKQLDYISGPKGLYSDRLFSESKVRDLLMGKLQLRTSNQLSIAFLGQSLYFRQAAIENTFLDANCNFVAYTFGENPDKALMELNALDPDIVIVFRPELFEQFEEFFADRISIGYFTEPLPNKSYSKHKDLELRFNFLKNSYIGRTKVFDLFVGYNPLFGQSLESIVDIWGYFPIPVRDDIILPTDLDQSALSVEAGLFVGRTTSYRSSFLEPIKHRYGWTVLDNAHLVDLLPYSVALNLHNENYGNFENRNFLHMALGHLLLTEPQEVSLDLSPGFTHLEFNKPSELVDLIEYIDENPDDVNQLRDNGRKFVRRYSSSVTWSKLLSDLCEVLN